MNDSNFNDVSLNAEAQVALVLQRTGLPVTPEERDRLVRIFPAIREWTDGLRLAETRYAEPALIFPAMAER
jgi:hypothetical protein